MADNDGHYLKDELHKLFLSDKRVLDFLQKVALDGLWYWDLEHPEHEWMSPEFWYTLGYKPEDKKHLSGEWQSLIFPDDYPLAMENFNKHCLDPLYPYDQVVRYKHRNGSTVWIHCRGVAIRNELGVAIRMLGLHHNITKVKQLELRHKKNLKVIDELYAATKVALEEAEALFILSPDAKLQVDQDGFIVRANSEAGQIFGYSIDELTEMNVDALVPDEFRAAHANNRLVFNRAQRTSNMLAKSRVIYGLTKSKHHLQIEIRISELVTRYGPQLLATITDVTEYNQLVSSLKASQDKNEYLAIDASTDPLTGLFNRRYFTKQADKDFANSRRYKSELSLILFDIDNFKRFNDRYGHAVGDQVLQKIAHSAKAVIRNGDTLARFGGEEFVVLLPMTSIHAAEVFAERIREDIEQIVLAVAASPALNVTISAGISSRVQQDSNVQELIERADTAMYKAKNQGKNRTVVCDASANINPEPGW
ncbi:diguanylate cyclase [Reinekea sp.]|jgi:diguanylate cyclase (GGDEF)-like protein/PAS domain S-box-containing protein|uniref:sensor domain-containing diguanylate cyclase n=1 Tax=Reinekea sp. TaxID=1970455 RepID=UPI002A7FBEFA|nr:diguanylate cyclase [Reinekea sp.]